MKHSFAYLAIVVWVFNGSSVFGQLDPVSKQYLSNQSLINPAYAGVHDIFIGSLTSRGQWTGIEGAPFTHTLSIGSSITETMGTGFLVISDNYGINNDIEAILSYSYKINWYDKKLSFGLQGSVKQHQANYDKHTLEMFDPQIPTGTYRNAVGNFGLGVFFKARNYYFGLSLPRTIGVNLANEISEEVLYNRHYYLSAGYVFDYVELVKIRPSVLVTVVEGQSVNVELNGHMIFNDSFWVGISLNRFNAAGFDLQYVEDGMRFGYVFELPINKLASASFGTHEVMFSVDVRLLKVHKNQRRTFHHQRYTYDERYF